MTTHGPRWLIWLHQAITSRATKGLFVLTFVVSALTANSMPVYAFCGTGSSVFQTNGSGGNRNFGWWEAGPQATGGYIQGRMVDPVTVASAAWVGLGKQNPVLIAQTGWVRRGGWSSYYVFGFFQYSNGVGYEGYRNPLTTPALNHSYEIHYIGGAQNFTFVYDGGQWGTSYTGLGWVPDQIQDASESKNRADHFPGSNANKVEFFFLWKKVNGSVSSLDASQIIVPFGSSIAGLDFLAGNHFYTYDKRCWD